MVHLHPLRGSLHTNTMILLSLASMSNCCTVCLYCIKKQVLFLLYVIRMSFQTDQIISSRKISACHPSMMQINRLSQGFCQSENTKSIQEDSFVFQDFSTLRNYLNLHLHGFKITLDLFKAMQCYMNNKNFNYFLVVYTTMNFACQPRKYGKESLVYLCLQAGSYMKIRMTSCLALHSARWLLELAI